MSITISDYLHKKLYHLAKCVGIDLQDDTFTPTVLKRMVSVKGKYNYRNRT
jgi:hypothetical protein